MKNTETIITSESASQTERLASGIGANLRGGECIELISDLGGGKTTFTRGLVHGVGSLDVVSSPTFTIGKQYVAGDVTIYHYDFYRLQEPGLVAEELSEALDNPKGIIIVEWAQSVSKVLPKNRLIITLNRLKENSNLRDISLRYPETYEYIVQGIV